jgi:hypothetical protein
MPIRSLLSETSFNSDQTEKIAKAFNDAWAQIQGEQAEPAMSSLVRTALAKRIMETAQRPDIDARKLRDDAIAHIKNNPLWPTPKGKAPGRIWATPGPSVPGPSLEGRVKAPVIAAFAPPSNGR